MKAQTKSFKAYIAANKWTPAFDSAMGKTPDSARAAIKRKNSPDWKDLYIYVVYVHPDGQEERE